MENLCGGFLTAIFVSFHEDEILNKMPLVFGVMSYMSDSQATISSVDGDAERSSHHQETSDVSKWYRF